MEKVYSFTNENVSSYSDIYNMNGANMLTILGSGDQYFTAILNGAKNVELIDINVIIEFLKFSSSFIFKSTIQRYSPRLPPPTKWHRQPNNCINTPKPDTDA